MSRLSYLTQEFSPKTTDVESKHRIDESTLLTNALLVEGIKTIWKGEKISLIESTWVYFISCDITSLKLFT